MSEPFLTPSCKSVSHVLMDASVVRLATIVLNAGLTIFLIQDLHCVYKFVVMVRSTLQTVMMAIMLMVMDAAWIVTLKLDSHVMVDHQAPRIHAQLYFRQPFQFKTEDNQDSTEKLF
jgi:hypothetical protein